MSFAPPKICLSSISDCQNSPRKAKAPWTLSRSSSLTADCPSLRIIPCIEGRSSGKSSGQSEEQTVLRQAAPMTRNLRFSRPGRIKTWSRAVRMGALSSGRTGSPCGGKPTKPSEIPDQRSLSHLRRETAADWRVGEGTCEERIKLMSARPHERSECN